MEALYLLLPLSLAFVILIGAVFWWAIFSGQFDETDAAARSILQDDDSTAVDQAVEEGATDADASVAPGRGQHSKSK